MFADHAEVTIKSGKGGDGHVSFHREKFVAAGGPDGGDGGKGGDVIFEVDKGMSTLQSFRYKRKFVAESGEEGGGNRRHGKSGKDLILKVPEGTVIFEATSHKVITDMSGDNSRVTVIKGGKGGKGNWHYATSTMQIPQYAEPGGDAIELQIALELKCIADVGLVGYPNVGKSTLLSRVSNAKPKIADYHFTTLEPNLGVVDLEGNKGFVMADIPGLIEGASEGVGLGHDFLRHIERTKVLIHVVDAASIEGRDPVEDIRKIDNELVSYNADMSKRPQIIAANKLDILPEEEREAVLKRLKDSYEKGETKVFPVSAATGEGLKELLYYTSELVLAHKDEGAVFEQEYFPEYDVSVSEPFTVSYDSKENEYVIEGPRIEKMLGYTNLNSEKGFLFFQKFIKDNGIDNELKKLGIQDGDTVRMYGHWFEYYD
ncbi:MAG: GTPase ObgE [Lachnospiraceae bacterium]|nr:GTPase ObgE [Lachnospiraceae bacterium]